jgi:hypothetical protein
MYCWAKKNQTLDLVEGSTPFKTEKMAVRGGVRNVKALAPITTERKKGVFIRVPLGTSAHKEGEVAMIGEWSSEPGKNNKQTTRGNSARNKKRCKHSPRRKRNGHTPLAVSRAA